MNPGEAAQYRRPFPILMFVAAAATVFFMAHHPTGHDAGGMAGLVHGAMLLVVLAMGIGFAHFAAVRGLQRLPVMTGLVAYLGAMVCNLGAAAINGFVAPALAGQEPPVSHDILVAAWETNQALAFLAVIATGIAYVAWSIDILRDRTLPARATALTGTVIAVAPAVVLLSGRFGMDVHTAFFIYSAHALWALLVGVHMWRQPQR